jgi:hypothetical protein
MGPVPPEVNLDRMIGQQLQQICIGAYDLQFRFEGEDRIRCTGVVRVELDGHLHLVFGKDLWEDPTSLTKIVGREVIAWSVENSYTLAVSLTDGAVIRLISEDSPYEDFIIDPEVLVW